MEISEWIKWLVALSWFPMGLLSAKVAKERRASGFTDTLGSYGVVVLCGWVSFAVLVLILREEKV